MQISTGQTSLCQLLPAHIQSWLSQAESNIQSLPDLMEIVPYISPEMCCFCWKTACGLPFASVIDLLEISVAADVAENMLAGILSSQIVSQWVVCVLQHKCPRASGLISTGKWCRHQTGQDIYQFIYLFYFFFAFLLLAISYDMIEILIKLIFSKWRIIKWFYPFFFKCLYLI